MKANEKQLFLECAELGKEFLNQYFNEIDDNYIFEDKLWYFNENITLNDLDKCLNIDMSKISNIDMFYTKMTILYGCTNKIDELINESNDKVCSNSEFEKKLSYHIDEFSTLSDKEIKLNLLNKLYVKDNVIMDLPTDKSIFYAKINHGYWEFMSDAYKSKPRDGRYREFDKKTIIKRVRNNDHTTYLAYMIKNHFTDNENNFKQLDFGIHNGSLKFEEAISKKFNIYTRGASVGILAMLKASVPLKDNFLIGDGTAPRALMSNKKMEVFFDKFIFDTDACLFLVPPHLMNIDIVNYSGNVYKLIVPPAKIHENWKILATVLIGYLDKLASKHSSLVVFSQGSSISPLLSLLKSHIDFRKKNILLRFFDMGQALDVCAQGLTRDYPWLNQIKEDNVNEVKKVFKLKNKKNDFSIMSSI